LLHYTIYFRSIIRWICKFIQAKIIITTYAGGFIMYRNAIKLLFMSFVFLGCGGGSSSNTASNIGSSQSITGGGSTANLSLEELYALTSSQGGSFVTWWDTTIDGATEVNQIKITTNPFYTYDYSVDWGDGRSDRDIVGDITHTYEVNGTYRIEITGRFPAIYFDDYYENYGNHYDNEKLIMIEQWGRQPWRSMNQAFFNCQNMEGNFSDAPDLSNVSDMSMMFEDARSFNHPINDWNVSTVTNMGELFRNATIFNQPLDEWNVSNVTDMSEMFYYAQEFNQSIGNWDVSSVEDMSKMFQQADEFNQSISDWNVSSVTNMRLMFHSADNFANHDLSDWNVSNVSDYREFMTDAGEGNIEPNWKE